MKNLLLLLSLTVLGSAFASSAHHEKVFQIWCQEGSSDSVAIKKLNKMIAKNGHKNEMAALNFHHLKITSVSAPIVYKVQHKDARRLVHHETRACATVTAVKKH